MPDNNASLLQPSQALISLTPYTDLSALFRCAFELADKNPKLLTMIERDIDGYAIEKKKWRIKDSIWLESRGTPLLGFDVSIDEAWCDGISLSVGRPRMPATVVLIFILIRGYLGGFKNKKNAMLLLESKTLDICFANCGYQLPGPSTVFDNVNAVQLSTLDAFHDAQIRQVIDEQLDDFKNLTFDSTDVKANSAWPTDSSLILNLSTRAGHLIEELNLKGMKLRVPKYFTQILTDIKITNKTIQLLSGKKNSNKKRKKLYQKLYRFATKLLKSLSSIHEDLVKKVNNLDIIPSAKRVIDRLTDWLDVDIKNLDLSIHNSKRRINKGEKVPAEEKFYSMADEDAAMIVKGGREPVLGYKPQLGRSTNGFVVGLLVPEGNAADSGQVESITETCMARTGIWPELLSFDDGYTNGEARNQYKELEIEVSYSGAKGKNIIPKNEYNSDEYKEARNNRSAVESLMFTLKHNHDFEHPMRRGINNVRCELLEKVLVYNFFRIIELRHRKQIDNAA